MVALFDFDIELLYRTAIHCARPAPDRPGRPGHRATGYIEATMRRSVPLAVFALLVIAALGDHYFRDEFYYLACSHRLAWGYVDQPPLSVAVLWIGRHVAGESL